ncbi:SDR family NAD(P)-dependent oxidoreductase [Anditalea andensis]|uniref:Short-chain dehydrogenase n=1 Tax=Anditalea andensis TaxID=1048983 RepID=A0A074KSQ2_9BACT|nr:glucose 1-dehydrogenase [Anditalea andensis]KEO71954.1 short-chain dehydrogenase [Anditalea andensis]
MELQGKVALITGAASGIGESTAIMFGKEGAKLIITDLNEDKGNSVVKKLEALGIDAIFIKADAAKPEDADNSVRMAIEKFGKLDIAINNAGIGGPQQAVGDYDIEDWNKVIGVNLSGVFYGMRYQIPAMLKNGSGSIINVASILGKVGFAQSSAYVAAKHGVLGLTKSAAIEYASRGIRINAIGPAFIKTPLLEGLDTDLLDHLVTLHPIGRLGEADEVAQLLLWLASEKASFAIGAYYPIDGGYLAR